MTDNGGQWERGVLERLATAGLKEQRRSRMWGIFFKLLFFTYLSIIIVLAMDWRNAGEEATGGTHTALVQLSGLIGPGTDASAERINAALRAAFKDSSTKGVVLEINSPGGSPVQAQNIYDEIRRLRMKNPRIPLYAVGEDICASGGYYVAAAADRIYVTRSSIVGSIAWIPVNDQRCRDPTGSRTRCDASTAPSSPRFAQPISPWASNSRQRFVSRACTATEATSRSASPWRAARCAASSAAMWCGAKPTTRTPSPASAPAMT